MRETKLCHHLLLLSESDRKDFALYLKSPFLNNQPQEAELFAILDQHILRYKHRDLSEQEAFALLYPKRAYDQNKFRKDCSALMKLLQQFLSMQIYLNDKPRQAEYFLRQLYALGENEYFPFYFQDAMEELADSPSQKGEDYDHLVAIGMDGYRYDMRQPVRKSAIDLPQLIEHAETAYCIKKMELLYLALNHGRVLVQGKDNHDVQFLDFIASRLAQLPLQTQMFYHLYGCTYDPTSESHYQSFRELLLQCDLQGEDLEDMYTASLNFCSRRVNSGSAENLKELFQLYQEMLAKDLLGVKGPFPSAQFKNMVVVAARLKEFKWIKEFLSQHSLKLLPEAQGITTDFCLGVLYYYEGNLKQAESAFNRVLDDFEDVFMGLDARGHLLRIYYETQNFIGLESLTESFRMFLKRNRELTTSRKAAYNEFIRYLRRLVRTSPHDPDALRKLREEIRKGAKIPTTSWLLEKIAQLLGE